MQDYSDDWDFIIEEQDDYEMANFLEDLDAESEKVTEEGIQSMNPTKPDQDIYQTNDSADRISRGGSYKSGSCGNCILYALGAIVVIILLGYLVSALSRKVIRKETVKQGISPQDKAINNPLPIEASGVRGKGPVELILSP